MITCNDMQINYEILCVAKKQATVSDFPTVQSTIIKDGFYPEHFV